MADLLLTAPSAVKEQTQHLVLASGVKPDSESEQAASDK